jgi:hypothetical protein
MQKIIDTNVPIIANGHESEQAAKECKLACVDVMEGLFTGQFRLVLDMNWEMIKEYQKHLYPDRGIGLGDQFLQWVLTNQAVTERCVLIAVPKKGDDYETFPQDERLAQFDRNDRKWVAAGRAYFLEHGQAAPVLQAADMKWKQFEEIFKEYDISVEFICNEPDAPNAEIKPKQKLRKKSQKSATDRNAPD